MSDRASGDVSDSCSHCGEGPLAVVYESPRQRRMNVRDGDQEAAAVYAYQLLSCSVCQKAMLVEREWSTGADTEPTQRQMLYPSRVSSAPMTRLEGLYAEVLLDYEHMLWNGD